MFKKLLIILSMFAFQVLFSSLAFAQMPGEIFDAPARQNSARTRLLTPGQLDDLIDKKPEKIIQFEAQAEEELWEVYLNKIYSTYSYYSKIFQKNFWHICSNLFQLKELHVEGLSKLSESDISTYTGLHAGNWLWNYSLADISQSLSQHPWVESSKIHLNFFPLRLNLEIEEKQPWITAEIARGVWVVDTNGDLISPLASIQDDELLSTISHLPTLRGLTANSSQSDNAKYSVAIQSFKNIESSGLEEVGFNVAVATLEADGSLTLTPIGDKLPAIKLMAHEPEFAIEAAHNFKRIFKDLKGRGESTQLIDLRFGERVIVK